MRKRDELVTFPNYNRLFVRPLYKKVKRKPRSQIAIDFATNASFNSKLNQDLIGHDKSVIIDRKVNINVENEHENFQTNTTENLPGVCECYKTTKELNEKPNGRKGIKVYKSNINIGQENGLAKVEDKRHYVNDITALEMGDKTRNLNLSDNNSSKDNGVFSANGGNKTYYTKGRWLRILPAPRRSGEPCHVLLLRCLMCQLGLATFLLLWTTTWASVIYYVEGHHELLVTREFQKTQNQLIIDLATELRLITPISESWRNAIERRLTDESQLTMQAVSRGARLDPGFYWDYPGALLFTVYVMTALGFGAPVPQTTVGRTAALVYAALAVPTHIFLVLNVSRATVSKVGCCVERRRKSLERARAEMKNRQGQPSKTCSQRPMMSKNENVLEDASHENSSKELKILKIQEYLLSLFCIGQGIPIALALFYLGGALVFGVLRHKEPLDTVFFPLQFTTSGGLETVSGIVRICYSIYVIGAMNLVACGLAVLRSKSSTSMQNFADKYRLYTELPDRTETQQGRLIN